MGMVWSEFGHYINESDSDYQCSEFNKFMFRYNKFLQNYLSNRNVNENSNWETLKNSESLVIIFDYFINWTTYCNTYRSEKAIEDHIKQSLCLRNTSFL
jgi:hypothetical protein